MPALDVRSAVRIEAEIVLPEASPRRAIILCHGLPSGGPKDPDDPGYPGLARGLAARGFAAATFSFRGCYGSEGDLSFAGWVDDLRAVIDAVAARVPARIAVAGSSLGGATALIEAADDERVSAVATLAAPAALDDLAGSGEEFLERCRSIGLVRSAGFPPDPYAWSREFAELVPERAASRLGPRPLLVVHGADDDVVPVEHAHRIRDAASGPVTTVVLHRGGHQLRRDPRAIGVLHAWMAAQR